MTVWIENPFDNLPLEGFRPQRFWSMAEAFSEAGHNVTLWTADFNHTTKQSRRIDPSFRQPSFSVRFVPAPPYRSNVSFARIASHRAYAAAWERLAFCEGADSRPDVIIVSAPPLSTVAPSMRLARAFGAMLVADVQDAWPETFHRLLPNCLRCASKAVFWPLHHVARRLYRSAHIVTGVCDRYRDLVLAAGATSYRRFYLGLPLSECHRLRRGSSPCVRLVYAGNFGRTYDLKTVIVALEKLPDATLDLAGHGEQELELKIFASSCGLSDRVRFHGYLDCHALEKLFSSSDIGVVPMADDSFVGVPNKFCDYSAAGLAVVSSLGGESAGLLARYGAGAIYAPGNAQSLADAVLSLSPECAANSRRMAEEEFDARRIYASYVKYVEGAVSPGEKGC